MTPNEVAERIRRSMVEVAGRAYEDAGFQGLCLEGRWEPRLQRTQRLTR